MRLLKLSAILALASLVGCVTGPSTVQSGVNSFGSMRVTADDNWTKAPIDSTPLARSSSRTWTQEGLSNDRLIIIPRVAEGESILENDSDLAVLPVFRADMSPEEIAELVESSIVNLFEGGQAVVGSSNLRPQGFGAQSGFMFDVTATDPDGTEYRGSVGTFVDDNEMYMVIFLAADPPYYDKYAERADAIIKSATLTVRTTGKF